jgi:hypothetical protein
LVPPMPDNWPAPFCPPLVDIQLYELLEGGRVTTPSAAEDEPQLPTQAAEALLLTATPATKANDQATPFREYFPMSAPYHVRSTK